MPSKLLAAFIHRRLAQAVSYVVVIGARGCASELSEEECREAALQLGASFERAESKMNYQGGCSLCSEWCEAQDRWKLFFNSERDGIDSAKHDQVCKAACAHTVTYGARMRDEWLRDSYC